MEHELNEFIIPANKVERLPHKSIETRTSIRAFSVNLKAVPKKRKETLTLSSEIMKLTTPQPLMKNLVIQIPPPTLVKLKPVTKSITKPPITDPVTAEMPTNENIPVLQMNDFVQKSPILQPIQPIEDSIQWINIFNAPKRNLESINSVQIDLNSKADMQGTNNVRIDQREKGNAVPNVVLSKGIVDFVPHINILLNVNSFYMRFFLNFTDKYCCM